MLKRTGPVHVNGRERLLAIGRMLVQSTETGDVLHNIADGICEATRYDRAVIVQYDRKRGRLRGRAGCGVPPEDVARVDVPVEDVPVFGEVKNLRRPRVIYGPNIESAIPPDYAQLFQVYGTLIVEGLYSDRLGLLGAVFTDRSGRTFEPTSHELETLQDYTGLAALSFQNALLFEESRQFAALVERSRIAAELHDGVTQQLFSAELDLQELLGSDDLSSDSRDAVERIISRVKCGSRQLRAALFEVSQGDQEFRDVNTNGTILDAVQVQLDDFLDYSDVSADFESFGTGPEPAGIGRDLVLRVVREGLANIAKHAGATQAHILLRRGQTWWMVEVHDDGAGDPTSLRLDLAQHHGRSTFGLRSLAADASRLGGRMWVSSAPRLGGVRVSVSVPVGRAPAPPYGGAK